ncbi:hypothetical protein FHS87_003850 [Roseomonas pecuniae]|uniref:Uncharacterized protein n=1 Tax=Muricoccus pecuniae TaxID=693023 RepID=A0A840YLT6_9PROT|nr:hypothetical protein [Roseomonas pecuniae]
MAVRERELYVSSNGDAWYLVLEPRSGRVFIRHQRNQASGGDVSLIEIRDFLSQGHGPEHQELLRLLGTLVGEG